MCKAISSVFSVPMPQESLCDMGQPLRPAQGRVLPAPLINIRAVGGGR